MSPFNPEKAAPPGTGKKRFEEESAAESEAARVRQKWARERLQRLRKLRQEQKPLDEKRQRLYEERRQMEEKQGVLDEARRNLYEESLRIIEELEAKLGWDFKKELGMEPGEPGEAEEKE